MEKKECKCGENCTCGEDCQCGDNCRCGEDCKCGCGCKCGKSCGCKFWAVLVLALGIALGGFFPGYYYYQTKVNSNVVTVKGLAEMEVKADLAIWNIKYVVTGDSLQTTQQEIARQRQIVYNFLEQQGIAKEEISEGRVETNDLLANPYRSNNDMTYRFIVSQTLTVSTNNVDLVDKALRQNGELVAQGITFDNQYGSPVSYIFTGLNQIKPQMLEEATKNAAAAAAEFAKSSDSKVGRIRRASQGVFAIMPKVEAPDISESQSIAKKVRVVSTIEYWLE